MAAARIVAAVALLATAASARPVGQSRDLLQMAGIESAIESVLTQPAVRQMVSGWFACWSMCAGRQVQWFGMRYITSPCK